MKNFDVAIIGFGPVGATAANMFAKSGFNIIVVESKFDIWDIPRAVHFDGQTQRIFQSMGIMDQIDKIIDPATEVKFLDAKGKELIHLGGMNEGYQLNGYVEDVFFNQPKFEKILRDNAKKYENIDLKLGYELINLEANDGINNLKIVNSSSEESFTAKYVLGCDGADSFIRKSLKIESHDFKCDQDWVVVDYLVDEKYSIEDRCRYQICDYKRPTTLLPITENHVRWEFMIKPDDDISNMENESTIRNLMEPHLWRLNPQITKESGTLLRSSKYTFHGLLAKDFKYKNCFLIGDAAHQTPPFLGQGLCQGIKDAYNLVWKINGIDKHHYSKKILDTYTIERSEVVTFAIETAIKQQNIIASQSMIKSFLRDLFLRTAAFFPKLLSFLSFSYPWNYSNGIIDNNLYPNDVNGIIIPQPNLKLRVNDLPFDQYIGDEFALLLFKCDHVFLEKINSLSNINIFNNNIFQVDENHIFNEDTEFFNWHNDKNITAVIIKPDKHVYGAITDSMKFENIEKLISKLHNDLF